MIVRRRSQTDVATKALLSIKEKSHGPSLTYDIAII